MAGSSPARRPRHSDLAGFHTFDYTQYFLRAVRRTLGIETTMNSLYVEDRMVKAETFPLGIDHARFSGALQEKGSPNRTKQTRPSLGDKKLIFSVDRLDYSKSSPSTAGLRTFSHEVPEVARKSRV